MTREQGRSQKIARAGVAPGAIRWATWFHEYAVSLSDAGARRAVMRLSRASSSPAAADPTNIRQPLQLSLRSEPEDALKVRDVGNKPFVLAKRLWDTFYEDHDDTLEDLYHPPRATTIERTEFKFAGLNEGNIETAKDFVKYALERGIAIGFKASVLETSKVQGLAKEQVVSWRYRELAMAGLEHEIRTGRVVLPRWRSIVKDADAGTDILALPELELRLAASVVEHFKWEAKVEDVMSLASDTSTLLQLADLFIGSIGCGKGSGAHAKDEFAQFMERVAGFTFAEPAPATAKALVYIDRLT